MGKNKHKKKKGAGSSSEAKSNIQDSAVSSTSEERLGLGMKLILKQRTHVLIKPEGKWYDNQFSSMPSSGDDKMPEKDVEKLREYAAKLLDRDAALYREGNQMRSRSDTQWIRTVLKSGTITDKPAAHTLLLQESAIHHLYNLDTLIQMVTLKSRRECLLAVDTLKELFLTDLLPDDRKLISFGTRPLHSLSTMEDDVRDKALILWHFEHCLKEKYAKFLTGIESMLKDAIVATRTKGVSIVFDLLASKSEQERRLLDTLLNKLGDTDRKLASKTVLLALKLVGRHPNMEMVVVQGIERVLYRQNVSSRAQYYAVCCLNQMLLSVDECDVANKLIDIYFSFFKSFTRNGSVGSKMLAALLTGVNRAYPYAKVNDAQLEEHANHLFRVVYTVDFNTSVQALLLLHHVAQSKPHLSDRFYTCLYRKLADPALKTTSKQALFLSLLFKALRADDAEIRVMSLIKRILQVCLHMPVNLVCAMLLTVSEVVKEKPHVLKTKPMVQQLAFAEDDDEERYSDVPEEEAAPEGDEQQEKAGESGAVKAASSWLHTTATKAKSRTCYDPSERNPLHAAAELSLFWELRELTCHFHPTVALFARRILQKEAIEYSGNPLDDFALARFLERFVYKNPKKTLTENEKRVRPFEPKHRRVLPQGVKAISVTSRQYAELDANRVPVEESFLHKYFATRNPRVSKEDASDAESVSDSEFDEYLDKFEADGGFKKESDFASEFKAGRKKAKKGDDDDEEGLSDEEVQLSEDEQLKEEFRREMHEADDDVGAEQDWKPAGTRKKKKKKTEFSHLGGDLGDLFASADEFSHILEEGAAHTMKGLDQYRVKGRADEKQLEWELKRQQSDRRPSKRKHPGTKKKQARDSKKRRK